MTQQATASSEGTGRRSGGKIKKGDKVVHASFGEGVVVRVDQNIATIAFSAKYGIRKLMVNHPSLQKK